MMDASSINCIRHIFTANLNSDLICRTIGIDIGNFHVNTPGTMGLFFQQKIKEPPLAGTLG